MSDAFALTWRQYRLERKMFWRNPSAAFFNFVLPLLFLFLFGAIFAGSQTDQNGTASAGTLVINPPGTRHSLESESGCIVLAIYEKPVVFLAG